MDKGVIFVAGTYGVGKSTLCDKISEKLNIPSFSAGDLISENNGETYGKNKVVKDKNENQTILISAVKKKLLLHSSFILAGHFSIFNKKHEVETLPEFVYKEISISKIILLEADVKRVRDNIRDRDKKSYSLDSLQALALSERKQAENISAQLDIPLYTLKMEFSQCDVDRISAII